MIKVFNNLFFKFAFNRQVPTRLSYGTKEWSALKVPKGKDENLFVWNEESTYIRSPNYISDMMTKERTEKLSGLRCLLKLEDDIRYHC